MFRLPTQGEKSPAGSDNSRATRGRRGHAGKVLFLFFLLLLLLFFFLLFLFFFFLFPFSSSIDRRRSISPSIDRRQSILAVPPGSDWSAYRSAVGPVCTGRYGPYRSIPELHLQFLVRTCALSLLKALRDEGSPTGTRLDVKEEIAPRWLLLIRAYKIHVDVASV
ncbi:hypothetical protein BHE74_00043039 [Ensete ventricosum]|nr:hypothetical protein BHE74_00043039 [Ensete ventricosum]